MKYGSQWTVKANVFKLSKTKVVNFVSIGLQFKMVCYFKGSANKQKSSPALQNKLFECLPPGLFWLGASKQSF